MSTSHDNNIPMEFPPHLFPIKLFSQLSSMKKSNVPSSSTRSLHILMVISAPSATISSAALKSWALPRYQSGLALEMPTATTSVEGSILCVILFAIYQGNLPVFEYCRQFKDRETKQVIAQGLCEDGLYVLRDTPMALAATVGVSRKASFELWHNRLGHLCTFLEDGPPIQMPVPELWPHHDTRPSSSSPCGVWPVPTTGADNQSMRPDSMPSSPYSSKDDNPPTDSDDVSSHGAPLATAPTEPSSVHQMQTRSKSGNFS
ncbi:hypothetical protein Tco_0502893 [Tanacetum coccineum]